jgi:hypothetical protein
MANAPKMTKKQFEFIANRLRLARPRDPGVARNCWLFTVELFAVGLADTHPNFDRARFIAACEG